MNTLANDLRALVQQRLIAKTRIEPSGCWVWTGVRTRARPTSHEYGVLGIRIGVGKMHTSAPHRWSYLLFVGDIPHKYQVDHLCKNTLCCNPAHLEAVTALENLRRSRVWEVNRSKTHCPAGHPYGKPVLRTAKGRVNVPARDCPRCGLVRKWIKRNPGKTAADYVPRAERTHCKHGHEMTDANTIIGMASDGYLKRSCRECVNVRAREYQRLLRASGKKKR